MIAEYTNIVGTAAFASKSATCYSQPQTPPLRGNGSESRSAGAFSGAGFRAFFGDAQDDHAIIQVGSCPRKGLQAAPVYLVGAVKRLALAAPSSSRTRTPRFGRGFHHRRDERDHCRKKPDHLSGKFHGQITSFPRSRRCQRAGLTLPTDPHYTNKIEHKYVSGNQSHPCYNLDQTPPLRGLGSWGRIAGAFSGPGPGAFSEHYIHCFHRATQCIPAINPYRWLTSLCEHVAISAQYLVWHIYEGLGSTANMPKRHACCYAAPLQMVKKIDVFVVFECVSVFQHERFNAIPDAA